LPATPASQASTTADRLVDAVRSALEPGDFRPSDAALAVAVKSHVLAHLDDLGLTSAELLRTFHCSRATLYRLFKEEGGVATFIRDQRLDRCLDELLSPAAADRPIRETATRWGFENPSHFHRLFTSRFEAPPSAVKVRRRARPGWVDRTQDRQKIRTFHTWARFG
jgi:AraC-like DNA-binding protein